MESIPTDSINQLYRHQPFKKLEMKELGLFPALTEFLHFFFLMNYYGLASYCLRNMTAYA